MIMIKIILRYNFFIIWEIIFIIWLFNFYTYEIFLKITNIKTLELTD